VKPVIRQFVRYPKSLAPVRRYVSQNGNPARFERQPLWSHDADIGAALEILFYFFCRLVIRF